MEKYVSAALQNKVESRKELYPHSAVSFLLFTFSFFHTKNGL